eukprot:COSAG06_NODE_712_length_12871_cov_7.662465_3_plen_182_part_00
MILRKLPRRRFGALSGATPRAVRGGKNGMCNTPLAVGGAGAEPTRGSALLTRAHPSCAPFAAFPSLPRPDAGGPARLCRLRPRSQTAHIAATVRAPPAHRTSLPRSRDLLRPLRFNTQHVTGLGHAGGRRYAPVHGLSRSNAVGRRPVGPDLAVGALRLAQTLRSSACGGGATRRTGAECG